MPKFFLDLRCILFFLLFTGCYCPRLEAQAQSQEQQWLDKKYELAQKILSEEDVNILKQEDRILLRFKKLSFPKNDFRVSHKNISILKKVQKIVGNIQPHQVSIEGHSDLFEEVKHGRALSLNRALAVQSHLMTDPEINGSYIGASGWGDVKPIASNQTKAGRAQNRRVDIVISANTLRQ